MNERQWLTGTDLHTMLVHVRPKLSDRKMRLLACAGVRSSWDRLTFRGRLAVETAERYADDPTGYAAMKAAGKALKAMMGGFEEENADPHDPPPVVGGDDDRASVCTYADGWLAVLGGIWNEDDPVASACALLREVAGNPFRPSRVEPAWLKWNDGKIAQLVRSIYANRAFEHMPILGDALEDAGCVDRAILDHCRSGGPHVRGCWVLDLLTAEKPLAGPDEEEAPDLVLPQRVWLVRLKDGCTAEDNPLGKDYHELCLPLLHQDFPELLLPGEHDPAALKQDARVRSVKEMWYWTADGKTVIVPRRP